MTVRFFITQNYHARLKLAAVDIGSNAARMQITHVLVDGDIIRLKKVEYVRFPLRLGHDVFTFKKIGPVREEKLSKLLHAFKLLMELHEVTDYMVCATSAMREAQNCTDIVARIHAKLGVKIQVIDGSKEAELTNRAILPALDEKTYIHIDVGGGSTELNLYVNKQKIAAKSFKIGSVRQLEHTESPLTWKKMKEWVDEHVPFIPHPVTAIGTGGNISKIFEIAGQGNKRKKFLSVPEITEIRDYIGRFSLDERVNRLQLNPDRADVIIPATDIYLSVMTWAKAKRILVPDVGLKDGIIQLLLEKQHKKRVGATASP